MKTFFSALWTGWKELAGYFADFQSRWLLTVFYFTIIMPFGLVSSLLADTLRIRKKPATSAWVHRTESTDDVQASKRLF